jgi:hypothetical protein
LLVATILKESGTMWRRKAAIAGIICLTAGCAAVRDQRSNQIGGADARADAEVQLEGCLITGSEPGTFVLVDAGDRGDGSGAARSVKVMSTRIGLSAHAGRRVAVRGREQATPPRSIHDGATLFQIRLLEVVEASCRTSG